MRSEQMLECLLDRLEERAAEMRDAENDLGRVQNELSNARLELERARETLAEKDSLFREMAGHYTDVSKQLEALRESTKLHSKSRQTANGRTTIFGGIDVSSLSFFGRKGPTLTPENLLRVLAEHGATIEPDARGHVEDTIAISIGISKADASKIVNDTFSVEEQHNTHDESGPDADTLAAVADAIVRAPIVSIALNAKDELSRLSQG